ncbi:hypothetical protein ACQP25_44615 (plasmid) [Microtetraspora malaysiensis]|uniref:hypothetical protein n=1 Tax=Microtetraspora malaysiensis TaxID=161358 RepID=UPI003D903A9B
MLHDGPTEAQRTVWAEDDDYRDDAPEPDEPDGAPLPEDLDEIMRDYLAHLKESSILGLRGTAALEALPGVLQELADARARLACFESLGVRQEYAISDGQPGEDTPLIDQAAADAETAAGRAWVRPVHVGAWWPHNEPPF